LHYYLQGKSIVPRAVYYALVMIALVLWRVVMWRLKRRHVAPTPAPSA